MNLLLNEIELRVLGCLIEKETATPDYYPLTLNALTNACNQKSNRHPVMLIGEKSIIKALDALRIEHKWAVQVTSSESRVPKYRHTLSDALSLTKAESAILCELFLRGPQTPGDLRAHASRLHPFEDRDAVTEILTKLAHREEPLVLQLPRETGKREQRWAHLFADLPEICEEEFEIKAEPARRIVEAEDQRIKELEEKVALLEEQVETLQEQFNGFKAAFE
jgi:uncharacterized protein